MDIKNMRSSQQGFKDEYSVGGRLRRQVYPYGTEGKNCIDRSPLLTETGETSGNKAKRNFLLTTKSPSADKLHEN